jgi:quercetin dioxygenase-like cupin family protein
VNLSDLVNQKKGIFEFDMGIVHHFSDGLYSKEIHIPKGCEVVGHAHEYSHLSILAKGRVIVATDEYNAEYTAPACIEIKAGVHHVIGALEDVTWFCIHATDETDASNIDETLIKEK